MQNQQPNSINLGLGELQFPTPRPIVEITKKVVETERITYTKNAGLQELRKSVAESYGSNSLKSVCVCCGAQEALFVSMATYVDVGDKVLISNPTFLAYKSLTHLLGGKVETFNLNKKFKLDKNEFELAVKKDIKVVVLNSPSNPTGVSFMEDEIDFIVKLTKQLGIILIVDEIYIELFKGKKQKSFFGKADNVLVVGGLSKSHLMTGYRIGWVVSSNIKLVKPIIPTHQYLTTCAPYISQKVAQEVLSTPFIYEYKDIMKTNLQKLSELLKNYGKKFQILKSDSYPFAFVKVSTDDSLFSKKLLSYGVTVIPGSAFGSLGKGYLRISLAVEQKLFEQALKRIKKFINNEIV